MFSSTCWCPRSELPALAQNSVPGYTGTNPTKAKLPGNTDLGLVTPGVPVYPCCSRLSSPCLVAEPCTARGSHTILLLLWVQMAHCRHPYPADHLDAGAAECYTARWPEPVAGKQQGAADTGHVGVKAENHDPSLWQEMARNGQASFAQSHEWQLHMHTCDKLALESDCHRKGVCG